MAKQTINIGSSPNDGNGLLLEQVILLMIILPSCIINPKIHRFTRTNIPR